jgi:hypothetical protein
VRHGKVWLVLKGVEEANVLALEGAVRDVKLPRITRFIKIIVIIIYFIHSLREASVGIVVAEAASPHDVSNAVTHQKSKKNSLRSLGAGQISFSKWVAIIDPELLVSGCDLT